MRLKVRRRWQSCCDACTTASSGSKPPLPPSAQQLRRDEDMQAVGIEAMNAFGGAAFVDVNELAQHRGLDQGRFANLLMKEKAVALPHEDPITYAVNAAKPLVDSLTAAQKSRIELLITCSESGIDFGKSISTY